MHTVADYLDKYRGLAPPEESVKKRFIESVHKECGIQLTSDQVRIHNSTAFISCHPAIRSELRMCATAVLSSLRTEGVRIAAIR